MTRLTTQSHAEIRRRAQASPLVAGILLVSLTFAVVLL